jgi:protein-S-isoprenylcysteine O-methyltransferase Ste14
MTSEQQFRWFFIVIFLATFSISAYFRRRARQSGETISRGREGRLALLARMLFAAVLYLSFITYMLNPKWMEWSSLSLPTWLRSLAAVAALGTLPLVYWVMASLGRNVSETFLTKESHVLVTRGPYRWARHPLCTVATIELASLSVVAANWFMIAMTLIAFIAVRTFVVPREEAELIKRFGGEYRDYQERTGRLAPRRPMLR